MVVFEATVKTLVTESLIAVAVTRQLRERHWYLSRCAIRVARDAGERARIECWPQTRFARRHRKMRRHGLGHRWMIVTRRRRLRLRHTRLVCVLYCRYRRFVCRV